MIDLALTAVRYRLAIEEATAALEIGRPAAALRALRQVSPTGLAGQLADDLTAGRCGAVTDRVAHDGQVFDRVRCYLPANHYYAQRHEGDAVGVGGFQWDEPGDVAEVAA